MNRFLTFVVLIGLVSSLTACQGGYQYHEGKINIVATTTMLGDLVNQIGGEKVSVTTLMGVGVDPHLYSAKASDTNALEKSDFIIYNGLYLEGKMINVLEQLSEQKPALNAGRALYENDGKLLQDDQGNIDPHIWFSVLNWIVIAEELTKKLIEIDPDNSDFYISQSTNYIKKLYELHEFVKLKVQELPEDRRVLVTAHDAFQYFAYTYGFEVEAIQGISTENEASIFDINRLVDLVIERDVKAIFIESSIPQKTVDSVVSSANSRGHKLVIGGELYSDSLGDDENSQYIQAFKTNVERIVSALK
jgi:manganese/zinc/iron transport system substrate-binding protein